MGNSTKRRSIEDVAAVDSSNTPSQAAFSTLLLVMVSNNTRGLLAQRGLYPSLLWWCDNAGQMLLGISMCLDELDELLLAELKLDW